MDRIKSLEQDHILVPKASARASLRGTRGGSLRDNNSRPNEGDSETDSRLRLENI
jgi:hypothetical protein